MAEGRERTAAAAAPRPRAPETSPARASAAERAMRTCPVCGHELAERQCKLYCPRPGCGYFLSCADFY